MAEYINLEKLIALKNNVEYMWYDLYDLEDFLADVKKECSADVVEVVRCKDCKHSKIDNSGTTICILNSECDAETGVDYGFISYCSENHFCSYGERITNND